MPVILCHHEGTRGSMFLTGNRIYHSTEYIRSVWITCRDGLFYCRQLKNLQTSLPAVAQLVFFSRRRTALCSRHAVVLSSEHTSYCEIDALRLKKYRLMTQDNRHNRKSSFTPSPAHTALRRLTKVVGIILGMIIGIVLWVVVKPMIRGIGWLISILTLIAMIYFVLTF